MSSAYVKRLFHSLGSFITFAYFTLFSDLPKLEQQDKINFFHIGANNDNQEQNINQILLESVGQGNIRMPPVFFFFSDFTLCVFIRSEKYQHISY